MRVRRVHKFLALFFWAFSLVVMSYGIYDKFAGMEKYQKLVYVNIGAMLGITLLFEGYFQWMWRQEDPLSYPERTMTEEEFEKRVKDGEKLVILDNMVIDIGGYAYAHPGGSHLINYNIGRDISKFIYGSYALCGNSNDPKAPTDRHTHSNVARKVANKHAIATLKKDACRWSKGDNTHLFRIDHGRSNKINDFTTTFCFVASDGQTR